MRKLAGLLRSDFFIATPEEGTTFGVSLFATMGDTLDDISESSLMGLNNPFYCSIHHMNSTEIGPWLSNANG